MATGKYISLEEVRQNPKLLARFIKQHPSKADKRFAPLLEAMSQGRLEGEQTSDRDISSNYGGTRTRRGT